MHNTWRIYFLNVGDGDCIYLENNSGTFNILIDGGRQGSGVAAFLREKRVDNISLVIASHCHEDHAGGLMDVVQTIKVDEFWQPYPADPARFQSHCVPDPDWPREAKLGASALAAYHRLLARVHGTGIAVKTVRAGHVWQKGELTLRVVYPPLEEIRSFCANLSVLPRYNDAAGYERIMRAMNSTSLYLVLQFGECVLYLPSDPPVAKIAIDRLGHCNLLKLSHHGCVDGSNEQLLRITRPSDIVISAAQDSPEFPSPETIELLAGLRRQGQRFSLHYTDSGKRLPYIRFTISSAGCVKGEDQRILGQAENVRSVKND